VQRLYHFPARSNMHECVKPHASVYGVGRKQAGPVSDTADRVSGTAALRAGALARMQLACAPMHPGTWAPRLASLGT